MNSREKLVIERLNIVLSEQHKTKSELARVANVTPQATNNWFNSGKISIDSAKNIADEYGYSVNWLLGLDEDRTTNTNSVSIRDSRLQNSNVSNTVNVGSDAGQTNNTLQHNQHRIDYLNVRAAAGLVGFSNEDYPEIISSLYLSLDGLIELIGRKSSVGVYMIRVPTDSMEPTIPKGSIVFIDTNVNYYDVDGVYAFTLNGALFIKRVQRLVNGNYLLRSDNKDKYQDEEISEKDFDNATFVGKFIRCFTFESKGL